MPFCPKCRFEYLPEVSHCPVCDALLVLELSPREPSSYTEEDLEPVLLGVVAGEIHARFIQEELTAHDIPSRVQSGWSDDPLLGAVGAPPPPWGSTEGGLVAIFVHRADRDRARIIYRDLEQGQFEHLNPFEAPEEDNSMEEPEEA